jgi:phage antirepressor YoqD-like protein
MNLITIHGVRGYTDEVGTAHLNLEDISRGLGFLQNKNGVLYVRWERVNGYLVDMGFPQLVGKEFIPENVFYRLSMKGETESAIKFQTKVADEILPSIRKHGAYLTPETIERTLTDPDFIIGLASRLKQANEEKEKLQAKIEADKPLVLFAESLQISKDSILVADLAKLLKQNGIDIGEGRLFRWLRENGYLIKSGSEYNMPTQRSMDLKIIEIKVGYRGSSDGTTKITRTPKITGKGQMYFINKFKNQGETA